jgi:hypothetical protein
MEYGAVAGSRRSAEDERNLRVALSQQFQK